MGLGTGTGTGKAQAPCDAKKKASRLRQRQEPATFKRAERRTTQEDKKKGKRHRTGQDRTRKGQGKRMKGRVLPGDGNIIRIERNDETRKEGVRGERKDRKGKRRGMRRVRTKSFSGMLVSLFVSLFDQEGRNKEKGRESTFEY